MKVTRSTDRVSRWLLEGDPAIRWQVLRDVGAAAGLVERERQRVAREGWGARLLAKQDAEGTWAGGLSSDGGLYSPKWISTTYTMLLLRDFGLPAANRQAQRACPLLLHQGLQRDGGINYGWRGRSETCITGMVLSILSCFEYEDDRLDALAEHLLEEQMPDGGWNCQRDHGATHASVHTTISVLEGLRLYELHRRRKVEAVRAAQARGREFLLVQLVGGGAGMIAITIGGSTSVNPRSTEAVLRLRASPHYSSGMHRRPLAAYKVKFGGDGYAIYRALTAPAWHPV